MLRDEYCHSRRRARARFAGVLLAFVFAGSARAVIVTGGNETQNTTALGAGLGWSYVGTVNGASGVYLGDYNGNHWVLTAGHVGAGSFTLEGTTYGEAAGSAIPLTLDGGAATDLTVFRLEGGPTLAPLSLATGTPAVGTSVTMIGFGINRENVQTRWTAGWVENGAPAFYRGYKWATGNVKRWGANAIAGYGTHAGTTALATTFENITGSAQATSGDSGGGVFAADGSLVGIIVAVTGFSGQPAQTSVFNGQTFSLDIATVRPQLLAAIASVPEPNGATLLLSAGGLVALGWGLRKARARPR